MLKHKTSYLTETAMVPVRYWVVDQFTKHSRTDGSKRIHIKGISFAM